MKELFVYDFGNHWGVILWGWFWNGLAILGILVILREIMHWRLRRMLNNRTL